MNAINLIYNDDILRVVLNYIIDNCQGNDNPYHNINHLLHTFEQAHAVGIAEKVNDSDLFNLKVAALIHDADHSAGKQTDDVNIQRAKIVLADIINTNHIAKKIDIELVHSLLDATEYPYVIMPDKLTHLQQIMRDIDLSQMFESNWVHQIIMGLGTEFGTDFDTALKNQYNFATGVTYHTEFCKKTYEPLRSDHVLQVYKLLKIRNNV